MTFTLQSKERKILEAVEKFANLDLIKSTGQVEQLFKNLSSDPSKFQTIPAEDAWAYRDNDQKRLRRMLTAIAKGETARKDISSEIISLLNNKVHQHFVKLGGRIVTTYTIDGVEAAYAVGVALLVDERYGLTSRVTQCGNPECGKFHLNLNIKGRPLKHCSKMCKAKADALTGAARQRRYREKHSNE